MIKKFWINTLSTVTNISIFFAVPTNVSLALEEIIIVTHRILLVETTVPLKYLSWCRAALWKR